MLRKSLAAAVLFLISLLPLHAQQRKDRVGGRVVSSLDERLIAHATITLAQNGRTGPPTTATSDDDGNFIFPPVSPGTYSLTGNAPGYRTMSYQSHDGFYTAIVTGAGLDTDSLVLQLDPTSTISGRIVDEAGDPVQQAQLTLYREIAGRVTRTRNAQTDTDGQYDFDNLSPGRYFLTAFATPWYAVHPRPDEPQVVPEYRVAVDPALDAAYPLTFYPHALDSDGASPIVLKGGNQATADMRLSPTPAVSLTVRRPAGQTTIPRFPTLTHSVFGQDEPIQFQMMQTVNGAMTFSGFAPGQYKLGEYTPGNFQFTSAPVDLTTGSVSMDLGNRVDLATLAVTIHAANDEALPPHMQLTIRNPAADGSAAQDAIGDKNTTEVPSVPPGDYRLSLSGGGHQWSLVTLSVNGKPMPDKLVHIAGGGNIPVDLTVSSSTGTITGFVRRDGKPEGGSMVVLVPAGGDTSEDLFRRDQSNLDGGFAFGNVPPGNYLLIAIDDGWSLRWNDPATLAPYLMHAIPLNIPTTHATTVHLSEPLIPQPR